MAMKVRYTVVNGEIIAENRGGTRKLYVNNPLGSVVALLSSTQTQTDTFTYWPYGESAGPGTGPHSTPFQFVGSNGYYQDNMSRTYVRTRTYRQDLGRWQTAGSSAPALDGENLYAYVGGSPATWSSDMGQDAGSNAAFELSFPDTARAALRGLPILAAGFAGPPISGKKPKWIHCPPTNRKSCCKSTTTYLDCLACCNIQANIDEDCCIQQLSVCMRRYPKSRCRKLFSLCLQLSGLMSEGCQENCDDLYPE